MGHSHVYKKLPRPMYLNYMALIHKLIKVISAPVSLTHNFLAIHYKHWLTFRYAKVLQNILQDSFFFIPFVLYFGIFCDTRMVGVLDFKYEIFPDSVLPIMIFLMGGFCLHVDS